MTLAATPYGQPSPVVLANVITGADGTSPTGRSPAMLTSYQATWKGANEPRGLGRRRSRDHLRPQQRLGDQVYAGRSMAAKTIQVQMVSKFGQWITIKRVWLVGIGARFTLPLTKGVHRLRIAMSVNQAGVGYLGADSNEVSWRTR